MNSILLIPYLESFAYLIIALVCFGIAAMTKNSGI